MNSHTQHFTFPSGLGVHFTFPKAVTRSHAFDLNLTVDNPYVIESIRVKCVNQAKANVPFVRKPNGSYAIHSMCGVRNRLFVWVVQVVEYGVPTRHTIYSAPFMVMPRGIQNNCRVSMPGEEHQAAFMLTVLDQAQA